MHPSVKLTLAALAAALLLSVIVSAATARSLSTSEQNIRATWSSLEFSAAEVTVRCPMTLEGSFHTRTIVKIAGDLVGGDPGAVIAQTACTGGTISTFNGIERYNGTTTPRTIPWHDVYVGFSGTLPRIEIEISGIGRFRFGFRDASGLCTGQYGSESDLIQTGLAREAGGAITEISPVAGHNTATLIRRDGGLFCPNSITVSGRGSFMRRGATTRITLTLI
jgi:hypothetical protein